MATKNFIEELEWRGMIHTIMPGAKEQLEKEMTTAYLGIDPTADSLHIGHLVGVMILKHFQMCGHRPLALIGGATGMIGDPSGKSQERNLLDEPTLRHNQEAIKRQLAKLLDFESDAPNAAVLVNNYDWMKDISFLEFIRDIGKCITVNYMMAKDSVKKRFSGEGDGMSFTEFTYQLVQGFDFLHLYQTMNCKVQLGGADQWGNITTGTELIRRKLGNEAEAFAITCPLITKADGTKFGKTESGNVWLDARYTSPYNRNGADPPQTGQRGRSIRHHLPAHHQGRRYEIRQDRERQRMARCALYLALQVLPVLAQRQRRGRQALHPHLHAVRP